ncbi:unnamed protein product [Linum tenue]|uniref:Uncharacterized protein n=1 Tax=Linum tenue TaxID=586396 RepID=A0AAV0HLV4_9ROSI|nr:unnamed protein product [Linum tenue]
MLFLCPSSEAIPQATTSTSPPLHAPRVDPAPPCLDTARRRLDPALRSPPRRHSPPLPRRYLRAFPVGA